MIHSVETNEKYYDRIQNEVGGFTDTSWGNDLCDSISNEDLSIFFPNSENQNSDQEQFNTFTVHISEKPVKEFGSVDEVISFLLARILWSDLGDVPVNDCGELDEQFKPTGHDVVFEIGTCPEDVWHWFEDTFNLSVATDLMMVN